LGHCHPVLVEAVTEQVRTLVQTCNLFYTIPQLKLAELLVENSCMDKVFFCNSGAEANESAVKLARRYGNRYLNGAYEVISMAGSFHGRTLAMVAATGQQKHQEPYAPLPEGFVNVENNNMEALKAATAEKTCAIMLEPVQGEGGVNLPHDGFLKEIRAWCDEKGLLLILDEIQTGIARTGTLFAYEQFGIEPDVMTLAKGLGGGVPIGALLAKEKASVFVAGEHGSTFGGNPLTCAAACATFKFIVENGVAEHVKETSRYLFGKLEALKQKYPVIAEARGLGLLVAVQFDRDIAGAVLQGCLDNGLLINMLKPNAIRFVPPLIIGHGEIDEALNILDTVLSGIDKRVL